MKRIERRDFLKTAAATAGGVALGAGSAASAQASGPQYRLFSSHTLPAPRRAQNVERVFMAPFPGNGMQATPEGLWIVDGATRGPSGERSSHVYLLSYTGEILRDFVTEGETPSGMTSDGDTLWIAATYSRDIVRVNARTGETISKHFTPGAGVINRMPGDPGGGGGGAGGPGGAGRGGGASPRAAGPVAPGTGAHGMEFKDGKLWVAVPPSRMIYRIDPATWTVEHQFPSVHKRPHGIGFEGDYLWEVDSDVVTFYKRDPTSGLVHEAIQLAADDPTPHGMSVWEGHIWWVDDRVGAAWVCRLKI